MRAAALVLTAVLVAGCGDGDLGPGCPGSSPEPPDVSGTWSVSEPEIVTSTCAENINQDLLALVAGPTGTCAYDVEQDVNNISAVECHGALMYGCVDGNGDLRGNLNLSSSAIPGCNTQAATVLTANSANSPSTAEFDITVTFTGSGCGALTNCEALIQTAWEN